MEQLLENVCLLLASRTRDVVKSALGFIKVAVVVMDVAHMAKHVQLVVSVPFPSAGGNTARELPAETQWGLEVRRLPNPAATWPRFSPKTTVRANASTRSP